MEGGSEGGERERRGGFRVRTESNQCDVQGSSLFTVMEVKRPFV